MKVILVQFDSVVSNELGHLKDIKVKLPISKTAISWLYRALPIPYSLKDRNEKGLYQL